VIASTGGRQEPFVYGSLGGAEITLMPGTAPAADSAAQIWADTKDTKNPALLEMFINRFGDSFYASLARARLEELKKGQTADLPSSSTSQAPVSSTKSTSDVAALRSTPPPAPTADQMVRFKEPLASLPFPMNGQSLEQLVGGVPLFPPIEGLEESVWKKHCNSCHSWNQKTLCEQGNTYLRNPKAALRVSHPYGGPEKVAMMQWVKSGCQ